MNSNYFLEELDFDFESQSVSREIQELTEKIGVDAVHCSGKFPAVFILEVASFDKNALKKIAEIQQKIWNESSVIFLYVTSPNEIRIYNCNAMPVFLNRKIKIEEELHHLEIEKCKISDKQKLNVLKQIFSAVAIDSGLIWTHEYSKKIKLQTKVDHYLVESLLGLAEELNKDINNEDVIHSLLMRSIFIMYLQDRKAIPKEIWNKIGNYDFLKILDDPHQTYQLFSEIETHFNGNVFPIFSDEKEIVTKYHLNLLKRCLTDGNIDLSQVTLFQDWRLFDFSFIRIELLSEIYENFLNRFDPIRKKKTGTYYTPPSLVELVLNEVLPKEGSNYNQKILDTACGSGIFLAQAYKRIVKYWINEQSKEELNFSILSEIMKNSIFGVELDKKSIKVAAFSLYLALIDFLEPKDVWLTKGDEFPFLIYDAESEDENDKKGNNLFRTDTIAPDGEFEKIEYDIIVGNPPFGTDDLPDNVREYCNNLKFSKQFVIPFIHKSSILAPKGKIALLFNTKLLTNNQKPAQNFRKWLFNDCYVKKVYNLSILRKATKHFGGQLFSSATAPVSIVFFQNEPPKELSPTIEYWAPKTFIKNHVVEGVIVDSSDIKFLPREICQQPDTKIWKIAHWGTLADYFLIEKLKCIPTIDKLLDKNNNGVGLQTLDSTTKNPKIDNEINKIPFMLPENINRFYTRIESTRSINASIKTKKTKELYLEYYDKKSVKDLPLINVFRRKGKLNTYKSPHILIKEGLNKKQVCASYQDYACSFNSKVYGIHDENISLLKALTCYINSEIVTYLLFLTTASWGIEREEIKPIDIKKLPQIPDSSYSDFSKLLNTIIDNSDNVVQNANEFCENINNAVLSLFNFSEKEKFLIGDMINNSLSLFFDCEKSIALTSIASKNPETESYAKMLCNELNEFFIYGDFKVNARVYKVSTYTPLCMVVLQFVNPSNLKQPLIIDSDEEFQNNLHTINEYTLKKYSQKIYIRKSVKYYDNDTIFIIKPNQKRFWTRSQGIEDAHSLINEIAVRKNERAD